MVEDEDEGLVTAAVVVVLQPERRCQPRRVDLTHNKIYTL